MVGRVGGVAGAGVAGAGGAAASGDDAFGEKLEDAIRAVDRQQTEADGKLATLAAGQEMDLHGTMIALEEANIALRAMTSARDKIVEAYQAIWNMQV